jgi:WD40 repeat protein
MGGTGGRDDRGIIEVWDRADAAACRAAAPCGAPGDGAGGWRGRVEASHETAGGHADAVTCAAWIPGCVAPGAAAGFNGGVLATGSRDKCVKVWQLPPAASAPEVARGKVEATLAGHADWVSCLAGMPREGGRPLFVSGSRDRSLRLWGRGAGPDDEWCCEAVLAGEDAGARGGADMLGGHTDFVNACAVASVSGLGARLASGGGDWRVLAWDLARAGLKGLKGPASADRALEGHSYAVRALAFCDQGAGAGAGLLASAGDDERVIVWDLRARGRGRVTALACGAPALSCCWGPGGRWLAAGGGMPLDSMAGTSDNVAGWLRVPPPPPPLSSHSSAPSLRSEPL